MGNSFSHPSRWEWRNNHLYPLLANSPLDGLIKDDRGRRGTHPRNPQGSHPKQVIQRSYTTGSLDLHIALDMLLHQFQMRDRGPLVVVISVRLLDKTITG